MFKKAELVKSVHDLKELPPPKFPEIPILGRSNVGKSSFINILFRQKKLARVSSTPGFTKALNFYLVDHKFYLVDLPGYGFAKVSKEIRKNWQKLVEGYLKSPRDFRLFLLIFDIRRIPDHLDIMLWQFVESLRIPVIVILNKADTLFEREIEIKRKTYQNILQIPNSIPVVIFSCKKDLGRDTIRNLFKEMEIFSS
ncbi:MAG: ribosome biogenesis GTP-binding protein YihA/YsxC [Caldimicrobium sp.]|nr:ribosome biogenesis GTP-binding protein YihA/YsxC [Caldimicrobium sp.]MCX7874519.1 ribosome biogenesis GTP-binding protein YihA/YsxC [Caldimicrobium sp.]MDW8095035.1 ribosome biogenesis GTP-binding protein YihA/YsxC [Caldimicrobium sp.]